MHDLISIMDILSGPGNHYAKFWASYLEDTLMLHACQKSELHTFGSFREIKTNSLLPRIADQSYVIFGTNEEVRKVGERQFQTSVRIPCLNFRPQ